MKYVHRVIDSELDTLLELAPAIAIEGAKGVGKTETAQRRATVSYLLDLEEHRSLVEADPLLGSLPAGTVLLDEWQRLPSVWDTVRRMVDRGAPAGRYLLTGSATPRAGVDTHSGAGRILGLRMRPMALHERPGSTPHVSLAALLGGEAGAVSGTTEYRASDYHQEIGASGFPAIARSPARLREDLVDGYLQRVIDRDLPEQGLGIRRPETLRRWLGAYAAASSTSASYSRILDVATAGDRTQPVRSTTEAYRDFLTQLWLLDPVPGWTPSRGPFTRLQQAPKHQLADPALALRLLRLTPESLSTPRGASMAGPLFESLATLSVRVAAQAARATVGHLRTRNGDREVDLVVEGRDGDVLGIEVKHAAAVNDHDVRHLLWLRNRLPAEVVDLVVLTTGSVAYRRQDGVAVVPLALLGA